jgi:mannose-6-phosphate isomerase-like protein (cupin superfamily)
MIIKGILDPAQKGRTYYPLDDFSMLTRHFVIRETTPENPFVPHEHEQPELWYIIEGEAMVTLGEEEHAVSAGDLVRLNPWVRHGLRSDSSVRWICMG